MDFQELIDRQRLQLRAALGLLTDAHLGVVTELRRVEAAYPEELRDLPPLMLQMLQVAVVLVSRLHDYTLPNGADSIVENFDLIAHGARRLLEVKVWSAYVLYSRANFHDFEYDWWLDMEEFTQCLDAHNVPQEYTEKSRRQIEEMKAKYNKSDRVRSEPRRLSELAIKEGVKIANFRDLNKQLSKFVHYTALSLSPNFPKEQNVQVGMLCIGHGFTLGREIGEFFASHLAQYGLLPQNL